MTTRFRPPINPEPRDAGELRQSIARIREELDLLERRVASQLDDEDEASEAVRRFRQALARRELESRQQELERLLRRSGEVAENTAAASKVASPVPTSADEITAEPPLATQVAGTARAMSSSHRWRKVAAGMTIIVLLACMALWVQGMPNGLGVQVASSTAAVAVTPVARTTSATDRLIVGGNASNADATALTAAGTALALTQVLLAAQLAPTATPMPPTPTSVPPTPGLPIPTVLETDAAPDEDLDTIALSEDEEMDALDEPLEDEDAVELTVEVALPQPTPRRIPVPIPVRTARIYAPGFPDVRIRATPSLDGRVLRSLPAGTVVELIGGPVNAGGTPWQQIRAPGGTLGWVTSGTLN